MPDQAIKPSANSSEPGPGLFERHFSQQEQELLKGMQAGNATPEVSLLRVVLDRLLTMIEATEDEDRRLKLYNLLFMGALRLLAGIRTHSQMGGDEDEDDEDFGEALKRFRAQHDL